jgi:hypothetical protein
MEGTAAGDRWGDRWRAPLEGSAGGHRWRGPLRDPTMVIGRRSSPQIRHDGHNERRKAMENVLPLSARRAQSRRPSPSRRA